jgi:hypothetical protein
VRRKSALNVSGSGASARLAYYNPVVATRNGAFTALTPNLQNHLPSPAPPGKISCKRRSCRQSAAQLGSIRHFANGSRPNPNLVCPAGIGFATARIGFLAQGLSFTNSIGSIKGNVKSKHHRPRAATGLMFASAFSPSVPRCAGVIRVGCSPAGHAVSFLARLQ